MTLKALAKKHRVPYSTIAGWLERDVVKIKKRRSRSGAEIELNDDEIADIETVIILRKKGFPIQRRWTRAYLTGEI